MSVRKKNVVKIKKIVKKPVKKLSKILQKSKISISKKKKSLKSTRKNIQKTSGKFLIKLKSQKIVKEKNEKPIGRVTHFFGKLKVVVVKFNQKVSIGTKVRFKGATTNFTEILNSMEYNHEKIKFATKGKLIGIKIHKVAREKDLIYKI